MPTAETDSAMLERVSSARERARATASRGRAQLAPLIAAHAARIEQEREIAPEVLAALHEARLFRMLLPRSCDGWEADPATFMQAIEELAKADGSTAWCVAQASGCSMTAAYLAPEVAREMFGARRRGDGLGAGRGRTPRRCAVDGRLSGVRHLELRERHQARDLARLSLPVVEPDGTPRLAADGKPAERTMLIPKASAEVNDIWRVVGLKGTGSDSYTIDDLFVPDAYTFTREAAADRREAGPLYRFTTYPSLRHRLCRHRARPGARIARCLRRARRRPRCPRPRRSCCGTTR